MRNTWYIQTVSKTLMACDGKGEALDIEPGDDAFIQGTGEVVLLIKTDDGRTRSIIHIGADGAASVARTKTPQ